MTVELPAQGIMKTGEWGDSKWYHVRCDCGNDDCSHEVNVEADEYSVQVHVYVKNHTRWWKKNRWQQIWQIFSKGYAEMETTIVLDEQTALNYAAALNSAVADVKQSKSNYHANKESK